MKFSEKTIEHFTVSPSLTLVQQNEKKTILRSENVQGSCNYCSYSSHVQFGNPSNRTRHLKQHPDKLIEYKGSVKRKSVNPPSFLDVENSQPKKPRQGSIVAALNPTNIKNKVNKKIQDSKLSQEVTDRINDRILNYIVGEADR